MCAGAWMQFSICVYSLVLSYFSRNKKNEEIQDGSVNKLAKRKEEIEQSKDTQYFHNAAGRTGWTALQESPVYSKRGNEQEMRQQNSKVKKSRCGKNDAKRGMLFGEREIT